jgi:Na+/H+ antiporter NhaA
LLLVSLRFVDRVSLGPGKVAVALLPMLGIIAFSIAMLRFFSHIDEFQRQTTLTALAIAGLVTAIVTMALGFLENAGVPRISMTFVWPLTFVVFGVCLPFVRRRYR